MLGIFFKKYTVRCPDGTPRTVYRNVDDVFPLHLKYTKRSIDASVAGLNKVKAQAKSSSEEKISAVLTGIDRVNQSIQNHFRAAYAVYEASPCTELPYFRSAVETIIIEEQKLRSAEALIGQIVSASRSDKRSTVADPAFIQMMDRVLSQATSVLLPAPALQLSDKMKEVTDNTRKWTEGL